jgi:hypothetical protein
VLCYHGIPSEGHDPKSGFKMVHSYNMETLKSLVDVAALRARTTTLKYLTGTNIEEKFDSKSTLKCFIRVIKFLISSPELECLDPLNIDSLNFLKENEDLY